MHRENFKKHPLIFIEAPKRWVILRDCVWTGPQLTSVHFLKLEYPERKKLFRDHLKLGIVTLDHVITELDCVADTVSLGRLRELLLLLNKYLKKNSAADCLSKLKYKRIIPVREPDGSLVRRAFGMPIWYLADQLNLFDSFKGKLAFIDFDVATVLTLKPLIQAMDKEDWTLSGSDESQLETEGDEILDQERMVELRTRAHYFLR